MHAKTLIVFIFSFIALSGQQKKPIVVNNIASYVKKKDLSQEELNTWHLKDIIKDTIPGISLERAIKELPFFNNQQQITVALLDTKLDLSHTYLRSKIWINKNEIPENNLDDDNNGYIDDFNGWNFLGNKSGEDVIYSNSESIRIIREYKQKFHEQKIEEIPDSLLHEYALYCKAKNQLDIDIQKNKKKEAYINYLRKTFPKSKEILKRFFPKENYTIKSLDSLYKKHIDSAYSNLIYYMSDYKKYKLSDEWIDNYEKKVIATSEKVLNLTYDERRDIIKDDPKNIEEIGYGNNKVFSNDFPLQHSVQVSGVLIPNTINKANGIIDDFINIMPLCVVPASGDEHDKDIAHAIRYAVDNGAHIINMSFGKEISLFKEIVDQAMKYAASKNVLIVCSAGNDNRELNLEFNHYPNDYSNSGNEITNNVINVGSISYNLDKSFKSFFSNYSVNNVDIFAPGQEILTTLHRNEYGLISGTSLSAPIVVKVAAIIKSCFPKLSAGEIKDIILKSGVQIHLDVEIKKEDGTKAMVPFSSLSKSGKIVNIYNALLMADQISNAK